MYQITLCNNFLQQATPAILASRGITGADATNIANYAAEARFIRAYQYWVLMDIFGDPPFVTETTQIGTVIPPQTTRPVLFKYIESELLAIAPLLPAPNKNLYGRADEGAWLGSRYGGRQELRAAHPDNADRWPVSAGRLRRPSSTGRK